MVNMTLVVGVDVRTNAHQYISPMLSVVEVCINARVYVH